MRNDTLSMMRDMDHFKNEASFHIEELKEVSANTNRVIALEPLPATFTNNNGGTRLTTN